MTILLLQHLPLGGDVTTVVQEAWGLLGSHTPCHGWSGTPVAPPLTVPMWGHFLPPPHHVPFPVSPPGGPGSSQQGVDISHPLLQPVPHVD